MYNGCWINWRSDKTLRKKKHFITANKALLAIHGEKLSELAKKNSVNICFEAAVAGAIPIINVLENRMLSDDISNIYGILNGTCNYILSQMSEKKISLDTALKNAQNAVFAEDDPYDDISGNDTAYKLVLLTDSEMFSARGPEFPIQVVHPYPTKLKPNLSKYVFKPALSK